jgi:triacylglycerol lipase
MLRAWLVIVAAIVAAALAVGLFTFGFSFVFAPRALFGRHALSAPYARQKMPPRLPAAFIREIWTAALVYLVFLAWPLVRGYNRRPTRHGVPIVFVHGVWVSRASWYWFMRMLARRGVTRPMYALAFNWLAPVERSSQTLASFVSRVLTEQGASEVDIVAHSWGGFVSRWYIEKLGGQQCVRQLIMIGTPMRGTWMGELGVGATRREMSVGSAIVTELARAPSHPPYATLWSDCDEIVVPPALALLIDPGDNPGFVERFTGIGHLTMLRDDVVADRTAALLNSASRPVV